jgi:bifunctional enzyme CysN/CysC
MNTLTAHLASDPADVRASATRDNLRLVVTGHVDHGKSTVIGRLLADTGSLPEGKLQQLQKYCERNAKPFEYAFLLDALKDERAQGITIDSARVFFRTARRHYIIIDAPGHIDFLKNMVTGASRADAALVVIDAKEGIQENSRRHGYLLSMLGIRQVVVLVNKMDLVGYDASVFDAVVRDYSQFLEQVGIRPRHFLPVAAHPGDNIARPSERMPWYSGPTVLAALDDLRTETPAADAPLRMPVQAVYKFTELDDTRRIVGGTVESGTLRVGDEIVFYPSGKKTKIATIEAFNRPNPEQVRAGEATGFTMTEQVYVARGEIATRADQPAPRVTTRLRANLFWLGRSPLVTTQEYKLKLGTARIPVRIASIERVIDASCLEPLGGTQRVERHQVAECVLDLTKPLAFDLAGDVAPTSRFVLVDGYEIAGGGIIREALPDPQTAVRDQVLRRNAKWDTSRISETQRAERYSQRAILLIVTGHDATDRKGLAREIEARLFEQGRFVYFLGMGNLVHGLDADLDSRHAARPEHLRRLGEVAHMMLDAGLIVIAAAASLSSDEVEGIRTAIGHDRVGTVWIGDRTGSDLVPDLHLPDDERIDRASRVKALLQQQGFMYRAG